MRLSFHRSCHLLVNGKRDVFMVRERFLVALGLGERFLVALGVRQRCPLTFFCRDTPVPSQLLLYILDS